VLTRSPGVLDAAMFGRSLHVTVQDEDGGARVVREALEGAGRAITGIEPIEPSLEDVFVSLVRSEGGAVVG
jgi:drug efflux transport system ATP-binding protein